VKIFLLLMFGFGVRVFLYAAEYQLHVPCSPQPLDSRIFILYTLYNLPEVFILAALVNYFDSHPDYSR